MTPLGVLLLLTAQLGLPFVVQAHARRHGPSPLRTLDLAMLVVLLIQTLFAWCLEIVFLSVPAHPLEQNVAYLVLLTAAISLWTSMYCGWWMGRKLCNRGDLLERAGLFPLSAIMFSGPFPPLLSAVHDPMLVALGLFSSTLTFLVVHDLISAR